jgi:HK97 family phage major capsid protein
LRGKIEELTDDDEKPVTTIERRKPSAPERPRSWGETFTDAEAFKAYEGHGRSGVVELGPVLEERAPITTDWPPDGVLRPMRWTGNATQSWAPRLLALANTVTTSAGAVDWVRYQPVPPSEASIVAEGDLKPEANITLELKSGTLDTIAHHKIISRQALEDIPGIQTEVTNRLRAGVMVKLQNLLADAINAETDFVTADSDTLLAAIRVGMAEMDDSNGYTPSGVLLNPADWADIDLAVLGGTLNGPDVNRGVWGLQFVASNKIPAGTAYVGDFNAALTLFQRSGTSTFMSDSHADNFLRNMLAIIAETRALAVVTEPLAMCKCTVTPVVP